MENTNKILVTAFQGTSGETLIKNVRDFQTLILPNDKIKDSEMLINAIKSQNFGYIISLGQRPNIKNKVNIETTAREREFHIDTDFDCEKLKLLFEQNGIEVKISHNAGTSFCNKLYLEGLEFIRANNFASKMVFVHVPFEKNINDMEELREKIMGAFASLRDKI